MDGVGRRTILMQVAGRGSDLTKSRLITLVLLSVCSTFALIWGFVFEHNARGRIADFKLAYYDTRCLLKGCDPYSESEMWHVYQEEGGVIPADPAQRRRVVQRLPQQVYLPTAFIFIAPFALLNWALAHWLWMALTAAALTLAAFVILSEASPRAPDLAFYLTAFILVNSGIVIGGGNSAGVVVGFCILAAWTFLHERFAIPGVLCLAASIALKPHDSGWVWLFFFLAGGTFRKRALQSLLVLVVVAVISFLWVTHEVPNWINEMHGNLQMTSTHGGNADPGPSSDFGLGPGMIINLQTVISVIRNEPGFYNLITYLFCAPLVLVWLAATLRMRFTLSKAWIGLAAISAISLLPLYHRPYDAKLLMLTIPACATLWAEGGAVGWIASFLTGAGILVTSDIPLAIGNLMTEKLRFHAEGLQGTLAALLLMRPVPIVLLGLGSFYLWVYARRCWSGNSGDAEPDQVPIG
jgi:Glycosyltransferase family 87